MFSIFPEYLLFLIFDIKFIGHNEAVAISNILVSVFRIEVVVGFGDVWESKGAVDDFWMI